MSNEQPVRLGFIGAGGICKQRHLPNLKPLRGVQFTAVCNRSEASGRKIAEEWGFAEVLTDWRALVAREDIDAVIIGTWPYMHCEMSIAALEAGKHVFCQARMCMNWDETLKMCAAARAHPRLVTMICPPPHRMPWEPAIKEIIARDLGEIRAVSVTSVNASCANPGAVTWREQTEYSGLHILQVGIIAETLNTWLGEYETLSAVTVTPLPQKTDADGKPYEIRIPQIVNIQGRLTSGAAAVEHHSGLALHAEENAVTIFGARGTLRVDFMESIQFGQAGAPLAPLEVPPERTYDWHVEEDFIAAVRAARRGESWSVSQIGPDFFEGAKYMRKIQAIHDSAQSGRTIRLDEAYPLPD